MKRPKIILYNPRGETHILPLALLHIGSMLPDFDVQIIDGRIEHAVLLELFTDSGIGTLIERR